MNKRYLLIVEGHKTEINILENVLKNKGFKTNSTASINFSKLSYFNYTIFNDKNIEVFIVASEQSRIHDIVIKFDKNKEDLERFFGFTTNAFQGIFLIFDLDHNDNEDLQTMFNMFNDEYSGLLLISSPCIEVLGDLERKEFQCKHIKKEYTTKLNTFHEINNKCNVEDFIIKNFDKLALFYLIENYKTFNEENIMEHPRLVIEKINKENIRCNIEDKKICYIRYFTTVIYVLIAFMFGLTKKINNYKIVYKYFEENLKH